MRPPWRKVCARRRPCTPAAATVRERHRALPANWRLIEMPYSFAVLRYESFCGGIYETNCYVLHAPDGALLFDAPDGCCDWLESRKITPKVLMLTHGHFDHVPEVAKVKRRFSCQIGCHSETVP